MIYSLQVFKVFYKRYSLYLDLSDYLCVDPFSFVKWLGWGGGGADELFGEVGPLLIFVNLCEFNK